MIGIAALIYEGGTAVSNDAVFDVDKHLVEENGQKVSKHSYSLKFNFIFDVTGKLVVGEKVDCIFKSDDDKKYSFVGVVKNKGKQVTVIHELLKTERYTEILNKIKT